MGRTAFRPYGAARDGGNCTQGYAALHPGLPSLPPYGRQRRGARGFVLSHVSEARHGAPGFSLVRQKTKTSQGWGRRELLVGVRGSVFGGGLKSPHNFLIVAFGPTEVGP